MKPSAFNNIVLLSVLTYYQLRTISSFVLFGFLSCVCARSPTTVEFDFLGAPHCDKLQSGQTHLLHNTKKDDSHQLLLRPAPASSSILVCRRAGTLAKCQTDALKFITTGRFVTRGHRARARSALRAKDLKLQASSTTSDGCRTDQHQVDPFFFFVN